MHITQQMEEFNIAYIQAMIAVCGFNYSPPKVDDHSVDIEAHTLFPYDPKKPQAVIDPRVCFQLKSTSGLKFENGKAAFNLKKKNYDDLRRMGYQFPRYLLVLDLPPSPTQWLCHKKKFMALKRHCYWLSLANFPNKKNKNSVTVHILATQRLTLDTLTKMLEKARTRESL
ncbi:hypothetical protein A4G19_13865 [Pasteurellaceae bacterium Macca]|nr:hypothetical protein [Pasteurellaceae bacterium Macca]MCK3656765.1 hypothetical protein [Pasteurellaceae bacterium Macca]